MDPNLRNLKDFLTLYNKVTELCFLRCIDTLSERNLSQHEVTCVDNCVSKFARFNQTMMSVYVEVQSDINQKRIKEMEETQKNIEKQQQEELQKQKQKAEAGKSTVLTPPVATEPLAL